MALRTETVFLSDDQRVRLTAYLHEPTKGMPQWHTRPAVVVLPGGGYRLLSDREAEPIALAFLAKGFHAFVLEYSVHEHATYPNSLCDASRALATIRGHATEWGVRPDQIAVCGFSAGGHLAASLGTLWNDPEITAAAGVAEGMNKPDALILCYPVISARNHEIESWFPVGSDEEERARIIGKLTCEANVGSHTPPVFLFHTFADNLVPVENSLLLARALAAADVPFDLHVFEHGPHGVALGTEVTSAEAGSVDPRAAQWFELATSWLARRFDTATSRPSGSDRTRAYLGDPRRSLSPVGERLADTGRFTLDTAFGDVLDDGDARTVLRRYAPALAAATPPEAARELPLSLILTYAPGGVSEADRADLGRALGALGRPGDIGAQPLGVGQDRGDPRQEGRTPPE
ncbi:alpha/beta hydrolase [Nocardia goodfellowii]